MPDRATEKDMKILRENGITREMLEKGLELLFEMRKGQLKNLINKKLIGPWEKKRELKSLAEDLGDYGFFLKEGFLSPEEYGVIRGEKLLSITEELGYDSCFVRRFAEMDQSLPAEISLLKPKERLATLKSLESLVREAEAWNLVDKEFLDYSKTCGVFAD